MRLVLLVAVAALAVQVVLGLVVEGHPGPLGVDRAAYDVLDPIEGREGREVMRVFTDVGSLPVVALVAGLAALFATRAGRTDQALLLLLGLLAVVVLEGYAKGLWGRPRPVERFYEPGGLSFPSGHSAQAITWIAAACVIGRRGLIAAAVVLALAIGLSRLYLHVHYLTDVVGGFALGTALFAPVLIGTRR